MDKLELFNGLINIASPVNSVGAKARSLDDNLKDTGLDSLDLLMLTVYLSDIYGVEEKILKEIKPITVNDMFLFMEKHKTLDPSNVKEALESVK